MCISIWHIILTYEVLLFCRCVYITYIVLFWVILSALLCVYIYVCVYMCISIWHLILTYEVVLFYRCVHITYVVLFGVILSALWYVYICVTHNTHVRTTTLLQTCIYHIHSTLWSHIECFIICVYPYDTYYSRTKYSFIDMYISRTYVVLFYRYVYIFYGYVCVSFIDMYIRT